ncbi:MAG: hypothetical protein LH466_06775 [Sphingomonas bacterium]|nr:hypothetical protein [Sphingomonas bacterium]
MSTSDKAFALIKTAFTFQERMDRMGNSLEDVANDLARLSEAHANLRDRVSKIEGYLRGRSDQAAAQGEHRLIEE